MVDAIQGIAEVHIVDNIFEMILHALRMIHVPEDYLKLTEVYFSDLALKHM